MKNNNKGFLLIETLITTCVIAALATSLYFYVNRTISNYEKRDRYDNVVDVYKVSTLKVFLLKNPEILNNGTIDTYGYVTLDLSNTIIQTLKEELKIVKIFVSKNNVAFSHEEKSLKEILQTDTITTTTSQFKEYIRLLAFTGETDNYRIIVHFNDSEKGSTFASLELPKEGM